MGKIRNLTPHALNLICDGATVTIPPDPAGPAPRAEWLEDKLGEVTVDGCTVPVMRTRVGALPPNALPEPEDGVILVVSRATAEAVPDRTDVVIPHKMEWETDANGKKTPVGAHALARVAPPA